MSRRTPIKELIAEDAGTPSSPIRRSTRIAVHKPGPDENPDGDQLATAKSKTPARTRAASKSPLSLLNDGAKTVPAKRSTRNKGSTSSLIEEEIASFNRSSPIPGRVTRRSIARSMSCSPVSEVLKTSTPQKDLKPKRGRRSSTAEPVVVLESIKETETTKSPTPETALLKVETKDEDLPFKKKKAVLLQTITEKSFSEDVDNSLKSDDDKSSKSKATPKRKSSEASDEVESTPTKENSKTNKNVKSVDDKELYILLNKSDDMLDKKEERKSSEASDEVESTPTKENSKTNKNVKSVDDKELYVLLNKSDDMLDKKDKANLSKSSPDGSLNLHLSFSEHGETNEQNLNVSGGSNVSEKENCETSKTKTVLQNNSDNINLESSVLKPKNSIDENSFYEPMDVDNTIDVGNESPSKKTPKKSDKLVTDSCTILLHNSINSLSPKKSGEVVVAEASKDSPKKLTPRKGLRSSSTSESPTPNNEETLSNEEKISPSPTRTSPRKKLLSTSFNDSISEKSKEKTKSKSILADKETNVIICVEESNDNIDNESIANNTIASPNSTSLDKSLDQADKNNSNDQTGNIIVATVATPVRRSPRAKKLSENPNASDTAINKSISPSPNSFKDDLSKDVPRKKDTPLKADKEHCNDDTDASLKENEKLSQNSDKNKEHCNDDAGTSLKEGWKCSKTDNKNKEHFNDDADTSLKEDENHIKNGDKNNENINSPNKLHESTSDEQTEENRLNITNFNSSGDLELSSTLKDKIIALTETLDVESSSDAESITDYIDNEAEEGEEDTPSEGSNDIIDLGESIGSTASTIGSDESYEANSFIDDDEEDFELLSGDEFDLGQEKSSKKTKPKRIIQIEDSSDEEIKEIEKKNGTTANEVPSVPTLNDNENENKDDAENEKNKEDSDMEKMSTQPYCGLTPPSVISVRDSPTGSDGKRINNKNEEEIIGNSLINQEDNLESLEQIKEHKRASQSFEATPKSPKEVTVVVDKVKTPSSDHKPAVETPNNSLRDVNTPNTEKRQRKRLSSVNIQQNISLKEISDGSVSERIMKVVEAFCSSVNTTGDASEGNISLNLSFDYGVDDTVGRERSISESSVNSPAVHKRLSNESEKVKALHESSSGSSTNKRKALEADLPVKKQKVKNIDTSDSIEIINVDLFSPGKIKNKKQKRKDVKKVANDESLVQKEIHTVKQKKKKQDKTIPTVDMVELRIEENKSHRSALKRAKQTEESEIKIKSKLKKAQSTMQNPELSDSDMSDDLDEELRGKYSSTSSYKDGSSYEELPLKLPKKKTNVIEEPKPGDKKKKKNKPGKSSKNVEDDKNENLAPPNDQNWQIDYLPSNIKKALLKSESKKGIGIQNAKIVVPNSLRKPKLIPSASNLNNSWDSLEVETTLKPTRHVKVVPDFHVKDYKNRMTFDSKRVKRMETKELLKRKEKVRS